MVYATVRYGVIGVIFLAGAVLTRAEAASSGMVDAPAFVATDATQAAARIRWLRAEIARHNELYFKNAAPEISDAAFDALKRELSALENKFPTAAAASSADAPALGDDRSGAFPTYRHREPMLSLEKVYTETELRAFLTRVQRALGGEAGVTWVVEPKFDGLAVSVSYEDGRLVRAVTRGNGQEGDDVTANVRTIREIPRELPAGAPAVVEVRGEIFIDYAEFARINAERAEAGEEPFANPRNLAAGTLKLTDATAVAKRRLRAVFYGLGAWEGKASAPESQEALHAWVKAQGLPGVERVKVVKSDGVWAAVEEFGRVRLKLGYPVDGVVLKVDSREQQRALGRSDEVPRWAVAYKFSPERVETRLRAITLQVGRTGVVTPVAELDAVKIGGTSVARATLHNADEIARRDLRVGDWVYVEKAGEVVPAIMGVDLGRRGPEVAAFVFPEKCPSCEEPLVRDGAAVRCGNGKCPAQVSRRVEWFASRTGAGISGLGPKLIGTLVESKKLTGVADVYRLRREDGVPERVLTEIERSKQVELGRFVAGLGFAGVGSKGAKDLATCYGSLAALAEAGELSTGDRALVAELVTLGVNPLSRGLPVEK